MKPKNKLQREVLKLSQSLPELNDYQRKDAIKKVAPHIAKYNSKKEYVCLDCGHLWTGDEAKSVICPHCHAQLEVDKSRKWNYCDKSYFAIVAKCQGFQVIRMFFMQTNLRRGREASYWISEAFQRWLRPDAKCTIISRARHWPSHYCDCWNWDSDLELRNEHYGHTIIPYKVVGHSSVIPEIKRNGYDGDFHNCSPYTLFKMLLTDNRIETILKVKQYHLLEYAMAYSHNISRYWASIKIAFRHKYQINDPSMWFDLLNALDYLEKDLRNPQLILPKDLKKSHDEWMVKKQAKEAREERRWQRERELNEEQRYLENLKRVAKDEAAYKKAKSKFFDLEFVDNEIVIKPLTSVKEFVEEGHLMHHCVFSNQYFKKNDVLIFHALVSNVSVATIELSLENMMIVQCRGVHNSKPEQYDRIVNTIQSNIPKIRQKIAS